MDYPSSHQPEVYDFEEGKELQPSIEFSLTMNEPGKVELVYYTNCILLDGLTQQGRAVRTAFPRIESYPFSTVQFVSNCRRR